MLVLPHSVGDCEGLSVAQAEAEAVPQPLGVTLRHCVTVELRLPEALTLPQAVSVGEAEGQPLGLCVSVPLELSVVLRV